MPGKKKFLVIAFLIIIVCLNRCTVKDSNISRMKLFDLNWKFSLGTDSLASEINFSDPRWRSIDLPHDWNKDDELKTFLKNRSNAGLTEFGWYMKQFEIPQDWKGKSIQIDFEGICEQSEVFVNGTLIKYFNKEDNSFRAILNPYLNSQGFNIIAVRIAVPEQSIPGAYTESGIFKHVWLVIQESSDLSVKTKFDLSKAMQIF